MSITIYYLSYLLQFLNSNAVFIPLAISTYLLYKQIIKKKNDLFKIFLILLPSLYPIHFNEFNINSTLYFYLAIDPVFIGAIFFFWRNCVVIDYSKISLSLILYLVILTYVFIHLIFLIYTNQQSNQGLTYTFKAILYVGVFFIRYRNNFNDYKEQVIKILILSLALLLFREAVNEILISSIRGHLIFFAIGFSALIMFYKRKLSYILLCIPFFLIIWDQSFTVITIFLASYFLVLVRKSSIFFNKYFFMFLINLQVICLITVFFYDFFIQNYIPESMFFTKFLYDRLPLFIATVQSMSYFQFQIEPIILDLSNIISINGQWSSGSHNYFLTMSSYLGFIPGLLILFLINVFFMKTFNKIKQFNYIKDNFLKLLFIILIANFAVLSTTTNGYLENIGFVFFLLLGSLHSVVIFNKKEILAK